MTKKMILLFVILLLVKNWWASSEEQSNRKNKAWLEVGEEAVRARLNFAENVEFRNTLVNYPTYEGKKMIVICGEVKTEYSSNINSGFKKFVNIGKTSVLFETDFSDFADVWNKFCVK